MMIFFIELITNSIPNKFNQKVPFLSLIEFKYPQSIFLNYDNFFMYLFIYRLFHDLTFDFVENFNENILLCFAKKKLSLL